MGLRYRGQRHTQMKSLLHESADSTACTSCKPVHMINKRRILSQLELIKHQLNFLVVMGLLCFSYCLSKSLKKLICKEKQLSCITHLRQSREDKDTQVCMHMNQFLNWNCGVRNGPSVVHHIFYKENTVFEVENILTPFHYQQNIKTKFIYFYEIINGLYMQDQVPHKLRNNTINIRMNIQIPDGTTTYHIINMEIKSHACSNATCRCHFNVYHLF